MRQLIRRFGSALTRMGYKKGEVFAIISPNIPEFPIALYGASGAGMPVSLVNPTFTAGMNWPVLYIVVYSLSGG